MVIRILTTLFFLVALCEIGYAQKVSLKGAWQVSIADLNINQKTIQLPGTLDDAGIGKPISIEPKLDIATMAHLARKVQYVGKAVYKRQIIVPKNWTGKQIYLHLEKVLWQSKVSIDGVGLSKAERSLTTPHIFDITSLIKNGSTQKLEIEIDNNNLFPEINVFAKQYPSVESAEMAHSYTNHTQIKWNGILGDIYLEAKELTNIATAKIVPDFNAKSLNAVIVFNNENLPTQLSASIIDANGVTIQRIVDATNIAENTVAFNFDLNSKIKLWDEFNPNTYKLIVKYGNAKNYKQESFPFGIRNFKTENGNLNLNGNRVFMRGNLECIIFPKTGYPPTSVQSWIAIISQAKSYGLNSLRFHSWCPPKAAFEAADKLGFYLQVELPHWSLSVGKDQATFDFLQSEAHKILDSYGNHPSFMFFSMGNELEGDFDKLNTLVKQLKQKDNRHLYATSSFTFQKGLSGVPQKEDDFFITQWTKKGWVRGQGVFNDQAPNFNKDYSATADTVAIPLISHEIGQYSVYPDLEEIKLYDGNLRPLNFTAVKNDLTQKGLISLAPQFLSASGKFAKLLYKEEIERALKTKSFDGFQLLQLQDFPGQGTALVGLLNAFWKSKGFLTGTEFKQFCNEVVPLVRMPKAVYFNNEKLEVGVEIANFYKTFFNAEVTAMVKDETGKLLFQQQFKGKKIEIGNCISIGDFQYDLKNITTAKQLTLELNIDKTTYKNVWNFWVYPLQNNAEKGSVTVTSNWTEAVEALNNGAKVLYTPIIDSTLNGTKGKFVPVFWSPVHFPDQPGTMGLLIKNKHQALAHFPSNEYSNWQWWDLTTKSKAISIDGAPLESNIVQPIDNFMRNSHLSSLFEASVGNGLLMVCAFDISTNIAKRPQAGQLHYSILQYMNSTAFKPKWKTTVDTINNYLLNKK